MNEKREVKKPANGHIDNKYLSQDSNPSSVTPRVLCILDHPLSILSLSE